MLENIEEKNPLMGNGDTPFHTAAGMRHYEIWTSIIGFVGEKNPKGINGITPIHNASLNGHL